MDNFSEFSKLLLDRGKTFDSCAKSVDMTPAGLRLAIRRHTLTYERVYRLSKHLGVFVNVVSDIVADPQMRVVKDEEAVYLRLPRGLTPLSAGQMLDWLTREQDLLKRMMADYGDRSPSTDAAKSSGIIKMLV